MRETRQEIFNKAFLGLRSQGFAQSLATFGLSSEPRCAYRGSDGKRCALGWCITDEEYKSNWEGKSPAAPELQTLFCLKGSFSGDTFFLQDLQACHDEGYDPDTMEKKLRKLAEIHSLTVPE